MQQLFTASKTKIHLLSIFLFLLQTHLLNAQLVTTLAGTGVSGANDGVSSVASFFGPTGVCIDASGNVFVADQGNHEIRKITSTGVVSTFAGSTILGNNNGIGTNSSFYFPTGICIDSFGNYYIADQDNNIIRKITPTGVVTTFAGSGIQGAIDGVNTAASFSNPIGVCSDASDNIYVADANNHKIRKITPAGIVTTIAGTGLSGANDGNSSIASFYLPTGICIDTFGNIYVADQSNHKIRKITPLGLVTTLAGTGSQGAVDGAGVTSSFNYPAGICIDLAGNLYIADTYNYKIRKISSTGIVSTFAGSGTQGSNDGLSLAASFNEPVGICIDAIGIVYIADHGNNKIRKISPIHTLLDFEEMNKVVTIYPNPTAEILNIELTVSNKENVYIEIVNTLGEVVLNNSPLEKFIPRIFNISDFSAGMYFINVIENNRVIKTQKIIKN